MKFDATAIFGGPRSKRYVLIVEDGKVSKMFAEPDNTGVSGEFRYYRYMPALGGDAAAQSGLTVFPQLHLPTISFRSSSK